MKKLLAMFLCTSLVFAAPVYAQEDPAAAAAALLEDVKGTYVELFDVITAPEYDQLWLDNCTAVLGEEMAPDAAEMLKTVCNGDLYGQEAIDEYGDGSEGARFDCGFINGVTQIVFDGNVISGLDENGEQVFSHEYAFTHEASLMEGMMDGYMYETADEDAGEFKYFFLLPDTPETTYHIEFRYGSDEEALTLYNEGDYAYWLAAGILADRDEQMTTDVINLFCEENLAEMAEEAGEEAAETEEAVAEEEMAEEAGEEAAETEEAAEKEETTEEAVAEEEAAEEAGEEAAKTKEAAEKEETSEEAVAAAEEAGEEAVAEEVDEKTATEETGDEEAAADTIEIDTAEELAAINDNLSGNYVLTADIDLENAEWVPIGTFVPMGDSGEEQETPSPDAAFTGTFDGNGHTISNLSINQPEGMCVGLFGCVANTKIGNFTLENADVTGTIMAAGAVGYAYCSEVLNVKATGVAVNVNYTELSSEGMYGGIVGAGMNSLITDCEADAAITLPDNVANAGLVGGGLEMTSVVNCTAAGTITAGAGCYGLGGISGCGFAAEEFTNCQAHDVTITAGEGSRWIGGITGYAGGYEDETFGMPVTVFTSCTAENVTFDVPEGTEGVENIVGAGFYSEEVAEAMGAPFDQPTTFVIAE